MAPLRRIHRIASMVGLALILAAPASCDAFDRGDLNNDGRIDGNDIPGFLDVVLNPDGAGPDATDRADIGSPTDTCAPDSSVDIHDIPGMVLLLMGEPCNFAPVILEGNDPAVYPVSGCATCPDAAHQLQLNAVDPNGDTETLQWSIAAQAAHGTASFTGAAVGGVATICYAPLDAAATSDTFTVRVEDDAGGADAIDVHVMIDAAPAVNIAHTAVGAALRLDAGAGFAGYLWSPGGETTRTIDVLEAGLYSVTVWDENGCEGADAITVTSVGPVTIYRVNAGGNAYVDPQGHEWSSDAGFYNVGMTSSISAGIDILGTDLDPLYRTDRWDSPQLPELMYSFPVEDGDYRVRLHFAETHWTAPDRRRFDVAIEDAVVLSDYDIVAAVGPLTADIHEFESSVSDGTLNIEFLHNFENPKICAIEIIRLHGIAAPPAVAITAPAAGASITGDEVTVAWHTSGDLSEADGVHVRLDAGPIVALDNLDGSHTFTNVAPGAHLARVNLVDANNQNLLNPEAAATVSFTTASGTSTPPTLTITSPQHGADVIGTGVTVTWQSSGDLAGVDHVHLQLDNGPHQSLSNLNGSFTFNSVSEGAHTVTMSMANASHQMLSNPEASDAASFTLHAPPISGETVLYRVNAGGAALTDPDGNPWSSDAGFYNAGTVFSTNEPIAGTTADALYQTERFAPGATPLIYSFPVTPGSYQLRLHFAEIWGGAANPGARVFDVIAEGATVLSNFDVAAQVGLNAALVKTVDVQVTDNSLDVTFARVVQNPKINAVEVIQLGAGTMNVSPGLVEWGHVGIGEQGFNQTLTLSNPGAEPITVSSVAFLVNSGAGHDFVLTLGGIDYVGDHADATYAASFTIPPAHPAPPM